LKHNVTIIIDALRLQTFLKQLGFKSILPETLLGPKLEGVWRRGASK